VPYHPFTLIAILCVFKQNFNGPDALVFLPNQQHQSTEGKRYNGNTTKQGWANYGTRAASQAAQRAGLICAAIGHCTAQ